MAGWLFETNVLPLATVVHLAFVFVSDDVVHMS